MEDVNLKGVVGIQNMGQTCYMNAVLQLLRTCQDWNLFCLKTSFTDKKIIMAYKDMLSTLWSAHKPAYVRPLAFLTEIQRSVQNTSYSMFGHAVQNDAHEYMSYLLDQFHEELKVESEYQEQYTDDPKLKMQALACNAWNKFVSKNTSEIVRIFFGMMRKMVICSHCNNKTYRWELFNSLKVLCEGETLYDWIRKEVNECTDIAEYKCDTCNAKHPAKKYSHLWKLPQHLFIFIDRFQKEGMKMMTLCPLTELLLMSSFFAEEAHMPAAYELCGIVDHHGHQMHGGHYTAQFKHPISKAWWLFDDEKAHPLDQPHFVSANYILSYRAQSM